jgi:hypothetical protein
VPRSGTENSEFCFFGGSRGVERAPEARELWPLPPQKGPSVTVRLASAGSTRDWAQILDEYQNLGRGDCVGPDQRCWELVNKLQLIGQTIPGGPEIRQREHGPCPKLTDTLPEKYVVIPGERGPVGGIGGVNIVSRSTGPSFGNLILFSGAMRGRPEMPHEGISG